MVAVNLNNKEKVFIEKIKKYIADNDSKSLEQEVRKFRKTSYMNGYKIGRINQDINVCDFCDSIIGECIRQ